jgi:hypothetical protein
MKRSLLLLASTLAFPLLACACGSLDANTGVTPTLATIKGQLVNSTSEADPDSIRIAMVWQAGDDGSFNVAVDLPVQSVFPASFTIALDSPPPASAMIDAEDFFGIPEATAPTGAAGKAKRRHAAPRGPEAGGDAEVAVGAVVAYDDENGNGKLDLVATGASGYVDKILATLPSSVVVYVQKGTLPAGAADALGNLPSEGYNVYTTCDASVTATPSPGSICTSVSDAGPPAAACPAWGSISTPITLSVSTDPSVNQLMCEDLSGTSSSTGSGSGSSQILPGRPTTYPSPCDLYLACAADGSSYVYTTCDTVSEGICEGTNTTCTSVSYGRLDPVPSDWPCTP